MRNINLISKLLKIKGIHYIYIKKIQSYLGFNIYKTKKIYIFKNKILFKKIFFLLSNFIKQKFILLQNKIFLLFTLYKNISHYKGKRLIFLLPLNSQRTHTNAKTIKRLFIKDVQKKFKKKN